MTLSSVCILLSALLGVDRHVPAEYPTIQAAIDAAVAGDEVVVADGVYAGPGNIELSPLGKAITIRSANGAASCSIDPAGIGRAFLVASGETVATVIDGFTIAHGSSNQGGAIRCTNSHPTIRHCIFFDNDAPSFSGSGGAIRCGNAKPTIQDCVFEKNTSFAWGGAIFLDSNSHASITDCTFIGNSSAKGGAIYGQNTSNATMTACTFVGNDATVGGAIFNWGVSPTIVNCTFQANTSPFQGGAIANTNNAKPVVVNGLFVGNVAVNGGGAFNSGASPKFINCTFVENEADNPGGGVLQAGTGTVTLSNCILWGNLPDQVLTTSGALDLSHCTVEGGWRAGVSNDGLDPLFVDGAGEDYRLQDESPCIDSAVASAIPVNVTVDLDGKPRIVGSAPDRGAYEWQGPMAVPGDLTGDGIVDGADLGQLLAAWGRCRGDCPADLNGDGFVDGADLGILLALWS
jgi:predicted outer membrane repeat protein